MKKVFLILLGVAIFACCSHSPTPALVKAVKEITTNSTSSAISVFSAIYNNNAGRLYINQLFMPPPGASMQHRPKEVAY